MHDFPERPGSIAYMSVNGLPSVERRLSKRLHEAIEQPWHHSGPAVPFGAQMEFESLRAQLGRLRSRMDPHIRRELRLEVEDRASLSGRLQPPQEQSRELTRHASEGDRWRGASTGQLELSCVPGEALPTSHLSEEHHVPRRASNANVPEPPQDLRRHPQPEAPPPPAFTPSATRTSQAAPHRVVRTSVGSGPSVGPPGPSPVGQSVSAFSLAARVMSGLRLHSPETSAGPDLMEGLESQSWSQGPTLGLPLGRAGTAAGRGERDPRHQPLTRAQPRDPSIDLEALKSWRSAISLGAARSISSEQTSVGAGSEDLQRVRRRHHRLRIRALLSQLKDMAVPSEQQLLLKDEDEEEEWQRRCQPAQLLSPLALLQQQPGSHTQPQGPRPEHVQHRPSACEQQRQQQPLLQRQPQVQPPLLLPPQQQQQQQQPVVDSREDEQQRKRVQHRPCRVGHTRSLSSLLEQRIVPGADVLPPSRRPALQPWSCSGDQEDRDGGRGNCPLPLTIGKSSFLAHVGGHPSAEGNRDAGAASLLPRHQSPVEHSVEQFAAYDTSGNAPRPTIPAALEPARKTQCNRPPGAGLRRHGLATPAKLWYEAQWIKVKVAAEDSGKGMEMDQDDDMCETDREATAPTPQDSTLPRSITAGEVVACASAQQQVLQRQQLQQQQQMEPHHLQLQRQLQPQPLHHGTGRQVEVHQQQLPIGQLQPHQQHQPSLERTETGMQLVCCDCHRRTGLSQPLAASPVLVEPPTTPSPSSPLLSQRSQPGEMPEQPPAVLNRQAAQMQQLQAPASRHLLQASQARLGQGLQGQVGQGQVGQVGQLVQPGHCQPAEMQPPRVQTNPQSILLIPAAAIEQGQQQQAVLQPALNMQHSSQVHVQQPAQAQQQQQSQHPQQQQFQGVPVRSPNMWVCGVNVDLTASAKQSGVGLKTPFANLQPSPALSPTEPLSAAQSFTSTLPSSAPGHRLAAPVPACNMGHSQMDFGQAPVPGMEQPTCGALSPPCPAPLAASPMSINSFGSSLGFSFFDCPSPTAPLPPTLEHTSAEASSLELRPVSHDCQSLLIEEALPRQGTNDSDVLTGTSSLSTNTAVASSNCQGPPRVAVPTMVHNTEHVEALAAFGHEWWMDADDRFQEFLRHHD